MRIDKHKIIILLLNSVFVLSLYHCGRIIQKLNHALNSYELILQLETTIMQTGHGNWILDDLKLYTMDEEYQNSLKRIAKITDPNQQYEEIHNLNQHVTRYCHHLVEMIIGFGIIMVIILMVFMSLYLDQYQRHQALIHENSELMILSYYDEITQLPNRRKCRERLLEDLDFTQHTSYGCIMFDLNNLKIVNDTYGHKFGDVLIISFSAILQRYQSEDVFIGRLGGDEFIAIIQDKRKEELEQLMLSIKNSVEKFNEEHHQIPIDFAYGYDYIDIPQIIKMDILAQNADLHMYACKKRMKK